MWNAEKIIHLRRRLGWSRADLSARLGIQVQQIELWEKNQDQPNSEVANHLHHLSALIEIHAEQIQIQATADVVMGERKLAQINRDELLNLPENKK